MPDPQTIFDGYEQRVRPLFGNNAYLDLGVSTPGKAYEAFVMGLCAEAVRRSGGEAALHGINSDDDEIVLRGSPACINSVNQNYGYLACRLGGHEFEIHASVQVLGHSQAKHEVDVSVIAASEARRSREAAPADSYPPHDSVLAACECKCHSNALRTKLAREFLGVTADVWRYRKWACINAVLCSFNEATLDVHLFVRRTPGHWLFEGLRPYVQAREDQFIDYFGRCLVPALEAAT